MKWVVRRIGEKGTNTLPAGYSDWTKVSENEIGVRGIVHVNVEDQGGKDRKSAVEGIVYSSLQTASRNAEVKVVAVPLFLSGEISAHALEENIPAIYGGVREYYKSAREAGREPGIEKVIIVIDADEKFRGQIESSLAAASQKASTSS